MWVVSIVGLASVIRYTELSELSDKHCEQKQVQLQSATATLAYGVPIKKRNRVDNNTSLHCEN